MKKSELIGDLAHIDTSKISVKRLNELELEFRRLTVALEETTEVADRVGLRMLRVNAVCEAREIVRQLTLPSPPWCATIN
jgi:hypothetical protein